MISMPIRSKTLVKSLGMNVPTKGLKRSNLLLVVDVRISLSKSYKVGCYNSILDGLLSHTFIIISLINTIISKISKNLCLNSNTL